MNRFIGSKTLRKIFIYVVTTALIMVLSISSILYTDYEKIGLKTVNDYNIRYLGQVSYHISFMLDSVFEYSVMQYSDPDIQKFMHTTETGDVAYFNYIRSIGRLQNTLLVSPMIHSVVLYNVHTDRAYSTSPVEGKQDEQLNDIFKKRKNVDILKPIPRIINNDVYIRDRASLNERIKLFTFFIADGITQSKPESALAVNMSTEWLFDNLNLSTTSFNEDESKLMIIDENGIVVADGSDSTREFEKLEQIYIDEIERFKEQGGSFIVELPDDKKVVTCFPMPNSNWILVNEQPYDTVFYYINQARSRTIFAVAIFIIITIIAAFISSKSIYNPINNMVYQIKRSLSRNVAASSSDNDFAYIQKAFDISIKHINELEEYKESTRDLLKEYTIKMLIEDNNSHMPNIAEGTFDDIAVLSHKGEMIIVLLKIDQYAKFIAKGNDYRKSILFMIINRIEEELSDRYVFDIITMGNGEITLFINISENLRRKSIIEIKSIISSIQEYIISVAETSFSAFISEPVKSQKSLSSCYMELKKVVKYRIMYSSKCILDEDSIKSKMTEVVHEYPESIEENINKNLKTGNLENTLAEFRLFMDYVQAMDVDNFLMSLSRLAISINKTVNQININRIGEISLNFNEFFIAISSAETIDDIKSEFCNLIVLINEQQEETTQTRNHHIAQLIIEYIEQNYNDKSLNLKELASNFKISYGYMLLIFKESQNQSLPEYLNMVRLKKAAELLCTTGDSVSKIMNNVGYDNESNFYRLFKKHFGATPRQYRINRTAAQKSNST